MFEGFREVNGWQGVDNGLLHAYQFVIGHEYGGEHEHIVMIGDRWKYPIDNGNTWEQTNGEGMDGVG